MLCINGEQVFKEHQYAAKYYKNVKIYAAKYEPADAKIRKLSVSYQQWDSLCKIKKKIF